MNVELVGGPFCGLPYAVHEPLPMKIYFQKIAAVQVPVMADEAAPIMPPPIATLSYTRVGARTYLFDKSTVTG